MRLDIHTNHRLLFALPALIYLGLVAVSAILPASAAPHAAPEDDPVLLYGREVYERHGCYYCHTQQIRGDERKAMDVDGSRVVPVLEPDAQFGREPPSAAEEYARQSPPLLGTLRTGPDLFMVGHRLPGAQWHYWHLYDPRSVSPDSLMPPFRFLFSTTEPPAHRGVEPQRVDVIESLGVEGTELWAKPETVALVQYLMSLGRDRDGGNP